MENFPEFQNENMGGCQKFDYAPLSIINSVPRTVNEKLTDDIAFKTNCDWLTGNAVINTLEFTEEQSPSDSGDYFKTKIVGVVPSLTNDYVALFNKMKQVRHIVRLTDQNGCIRICGVDGGMKFSYTQGSKKAPSGASGFEFQFTSETAKPSTFAK